MSRPPRPLVRARAAALLAAAFGLAAAFEARAEIKLNPQGWRFPNLVTSSKEAIYVSDRTPLIPGKETLLKGYRKGDGTAFMTYEIEGKIFGVEIDTDGKPPFEFSLLDTDGDGKFETKIIASPENKDRAYVPQWVIDHYYSLHPEMKNPSPGIRPKPPSLAPPVAPAPNAAALPEKKKLPPPEVESRPNP